MSKTAKILLSLIFLCFFAFLYLVLSIEKINLSGESQSGIAYSKKQKQTVKKIDWPKIEQDYKNSIKGILADYLRLIKNNNLDVYEIQELRDRLLSITVPPKYKDLHFQLVVAMGKMEKFLENGDKELKLAQENIISNLQNNYQWLNVN